MSVPPDPRDKFIELVDLDSSRVLLAPHITFVCGGPVDVTTTTNHSVRNMFMNQSGREPARSAGFILAENFKDWQSGYSDLSAFENDIAAISSIIVVILESPGALAELGLFFANPTLREKMVVVVHSGHHISESFIKFGLLEPLEKKKDDAVLVYEIDTADVEKVEAKEVELILADVWGIADKIEKSTKFDNADHGHRIFLVFQLVDLFTILTFNEIAVFLDKLSVPLSKKELQAALYILERFSLVRSEKRSSQIFYFVKNGTPDRVELHLKRESKKAGVVRRYDTRAIKLEVLDYYESEMKTNQSFNRRLNLWRRRSGISP